MAALRKAITIFRLEVENYPSIFFIAAKLDFQLSHAQLPAAPASEQLGRE
jgi:hypothetical protein